MPDTTVEIPLVEDTTTTDPEVELEEPTEDTEETPEEPADDPGTFPRSYVEELRQEAGRYRQRAQRADDLAAALWTARVEATGRLADASDLPLPEDGDPLDVEAVTTAVEELLARKPHLASRKPRGDVGQGVSGPTDTVDLAGILRSRA